MNKKSFLLITALVLAACGDDSTDEGTGAAGTSGSAGSAGSSSADRPTNIQSLTADTASGKTLFTEKCAVCHGADGKSGSANKNTPAFVKQSATEAINVVLKGKESMPAFSGLTDQQIADILGYVKTL